jgi:hypothetical protein
MRIWQFDGQESGQRKGSSCHWTIRRRRIAGYCLGLPIARCSYSRHRQFQRGKRLRSVITAMQACQWKIWESTHQPPV